MTVNHAVMVKNAKVIGANITTGSSTGAITVNLGNQWD
tara:strand:+ start:47 stop:160 length:114 start_codon:yes stop_codon:yes gene_type:complete